MFSSNLILRFEIIITPTHVVSYVPFPCFASFSTDLSALGTILKQSILLFFDNTFGNPDIFRKRNFFHGGRGGGSFGVEIYENKRKDVWSVARERIRESLWR